MNNETIKELRKQINKPRLRRIIREIEKFPERFDMRQFHAKIDAKDEHSAYDEFKKDSNCTVGSCGTSHCVAGWAQLLWARDRGCVTELNEKLKSQDFSCDFGCDITSKNIPVDAEVAGEEWLGLEYRLSRKLFYDFDLTVKDLKKIAR